MIGAGGGSAGVKGVFRTWNWPHMPVRIFTYRVGGDATNGASMKDMACTNKGRFLILLKLDEKENMGFMLRVFRLCMDSKQQQSQIELAKGKLL